MAAAQLTEKAQRFPEEYIIDFNATKAAERSGYSAKSAYSQGQRLLKKVEIQEQIQKLIAERSKRNQVDADWVFQKWIDLVDICMSAKPVMVRLNGKLVESGEYRIDSNGANKALENIAKHLGMFAEDNKQKQSQFTNIEQVINIIAEERAKINGNSRLKNINN